MATLPIKLRDQFVEQLREASAHTETVFVRLGDTLPSLIEEMKRSLTASHQQIQTLCGTSGCTDAPGARGATGLTNQVHTAVDNSAREFHALYTQDDELFSHLRTAIDRLSEITDSITHIKMDSEDMELVSLNAMTVALKAGSAGRAFSYITEELKRLASRTIALSNQIEQRGQTLLGTFTDVSTTLEETQRVQSEFFQGFQQRIMASVSDVERAAGTLIGGMRTLQERSRALEQPMYRIMESIQLQDIIRQSIDHIILALNAIQDPDADDPEAWRDELVFVQRIPSLAEALLEDVLEQINRGVALFGSLIREAADELNALERDRSALIDGSDDAEIQQHFRAARDLFTSLVDDLKRNVTQKEKLLERSDAIMSDVEALESDFRVFTSMVTRFRSIDIASRIEVAKQQVLQRMGSTVQQMNALTVKIERDVDQSLEVTRRFIDSITTAVQTFRSQHEQEQRFAERFAEDIRAQYQAIEAMDERIMRLISGFSLFTGRFMSLFQEAANDLGELRERCAALSTLQKGLRTLEQHIGDVVRTNYPELLGIVTEISDQRLRSIIDRFTIFDHKQRAGSAAGIDFGAGAEAGDVTLF